MYRFLLAVLLLLSLFLVGCSFSKACTVEIVNNTESDSLEPEVFVDDLDKWLPEFTEGDVASKSFESATSGSELYFYPQGCPGEEYVFVLSGGDVRLDVYDDAVLASGAVSAHRINRSLGKPGEGVSLKMTVFDLTEARSPSVEVRVPGFDWWSPDLSSGEASRKYSDLALRGAYEFYIYPDGRSSSEIMVVVVPITDGDTFNVKVYDKKVNVWGTARLLFYVDGNESDFKRY
jgi:hypothetical protein